MANDVVKGKISEFLKRINRKRVLFVVHLLFNLLACWMIYVEFTKVFIEIGELAKHAETLDDISSINIKGLFKPLISWILIGLESGLLMFGYLAVSYWKNAKIKVK